MNRPGEHRGQVAVACAQDADKAVAPCAEARSNPLPLAYFVLAFIGFSVFQASLQLGDIGSPFNASNITIPALFVEGAIFVGVATLSYFDRMSTTRPVLGVALVCLIPTVFAYLGVGELSSRLYYFLKICANAGSATIMICWITVFMSVGAKRAGIAMIATFGVAFGLVFLAETFKLTSNSVVGLVLYLISFVCLLIVVTKVERGGHVVRFSISHTPLRYSYDKVWRAIAGAALFSAIYGFVSQTDFLANFPVYTQTPLVVLISLVAVAVSAAWYFISRDSFDVDNVFPYMSALFASVLLYRCTNQYDYSFAVALMTALLLYYYMVLWVIFLREAYNRKLPALFLLCIALGISRLALAVGRLVSIRVYQGDLPISTQGITFLFIGIIWLLLIGMIMHFISYARSQKKIGLYASQEQREEEHDVAVAHDEPSGESHFEATFKQIADTCGLSEREREIVREFALGKSSRVIAEEFVLSEHTVKAHIRNSYKKLAINSKQELIALFRHE